MQPKRSETKSQEESFFEDPEKKIINKKLITEVAHEYGVKFVKEGIPASQLRNFFNDVRSIEAKVKAGNSFDEVMPHILMLKAKAYYAAGRNNKLKPFKEFITKYVDRIETKEDFDAFVKFFEAVVAYFYGEGGGKNK